MDSKFNFSPKKEKLIVSQIETQIVFFKNLLTGIKYYISGSFLMNLTFAPEKEFSDIDLYFSRKKDYGRALWCILMFQMWHEMFIEKNNYKNFLVR